MEPNIQKQPQPAKPTSGATSAATGQTVMDKVSTAAQAVGEQVADRSAEIIDQPKQKVSEAYEQTSQSVTQQYEKAIDYGRKNPEKTTLIAFGIGIGVGLVLAGSFSRSRSRNRVVEPFLNAVLTLAHELLR